MTDAPTWPAIVDEALVERMIPAVQIAIREAVAGRPFDPAADDVVGLNAPDVANVLLMVLASILETAPACATPRGARLLAEAAGRELALLIRDTRRLRAATTGIDDGTIR